MTDETKWKLAQKTKQNWELGIYKNRKRRNDMELYLVEMEAGEVENKELYVIAESFNKARTC